MAETLRAQIPVKSSACDFWKASINANIYPKIVPTFYDHIEILQGDAISEGSIYIVYTTGDVHFASIVKVKVLEIDTANKQATYEFIDGDFSKSYKTYKTGVKINPMGDDGSEGCLVNWFSEYEKKSPEIPDPSFHRDAVIKILQQIDAYLLKE